MPSLILIPRWAKDDLAYKMHEQAHAEQQRVDGVLTFWWRYLTSKTARQAYEVEAYKVQIAHGASAITCAMHLCRDYWLGITQAQALKLLETP